MNLKESKQSNCLVAMYLYEMPLERNLAECIYTLAEQSKPVDLLIYTHGLSSENIERIKEITLAPYYSISKREENGEIKEEIVKATKSVNCSHVICETPLSFAQIFNKTFNIADESGYDFISVIEPDDSYSLKWFNTVETYASENPEIGVFLPMMRNSINGSFSGLLNEASWAEGMAEEAGKIDVNMLMRYNCVNPLGALYKISAIKEYSEAEKDEADNSISGTFKPMKESMKLTHYYEFFLRMVYNDLKIMTIPRIGYELKIVRKNTFNDSTCKLPQDITTYPLEKGGITPEEGRYWFELAKKEYFFEEDRKKIYEPSY